MRHPAAGRCYDDAGITLAETVVSVLAGSIVLAAAAALFVPAAQNSDRARRAGQNLTVANSVSTLLQRQVRDATLVTATSSTSLQLCTYLTATAPTRTTVTWTYTATGGLTATTTSGASRYGDKDTFSSVSFSPVGAALATDAALVTSLTTSGRTGTGTTSGVASTPLSVTASPRSPQNGTCP